MKNLFNNIKSFFDKMINYKYFNELYPLVVALISLIAWRFSTIFGFVSLILLAIIFLVFTGDFNYIIPEVLFAIFTISGGFKTDEMPIVVIVFGALLIITLLFFSFRRGVKFRKMKSLIGLGSLAIINFIPIFWAKIPSGYESFYFFFIANIGYCLLYIMFTNGLKETNFKLMIKSFVYLGLLVAFECMIKGFSMLESLDEIFDLYYHLGWGLCNEAGIVMCFSLPFLFYEMYNETKIKNHIINILKLLIICFAIMMTTSRGSYLIGGVEVLAFIIILFIKGRDKIFHRRFILISLGAGVVLFFALYKFTFPIIDKIISDVFTQGFGGNGRVEIWQQGINEWTKNPLNIIMGPGMCSILEERKSGLDGEIVIQLVPLVMHSTLFETLLLGGIVGLIALVFHFYQKYRMIFKENFDFALIVGIGMICLDLYGMIDNTYHMYYFMIPLVLLLGCLDNHKNEVSKL